MARPTKSLLKHVEGRSFSPSKHRDLLLTDRSLRELEVDGHDSRAQHYLRLYELQLLYQLTRGLRQRSWSHWTSGTLSRVITADGTSASTVSCGNGRRRAAGSSSRASATCVSQIETVSHGPFHFSPYAGVLSPWTEPVKPFRETLFPWCRDADLTREGFHHPKGEQL